MPPHRTRPRLEALETRLLPTAYTVTTARDALDDTTFGEVTLRDVMTAIDTQMPSGNAAAGTATNTVQFAIGAAGTPQTIDLASPLPALTHQAQLDGRSQGGPHYAGPPLVVLDGAAAGVGADGLVLGAGSGGSVVRGLVIGQFGGNGIEVRAASGALIVGNYIGIGLDGTSPFGNLGDGILIDAGAAHNTVGPGNVLSDNGNAGLSTGSGLELAGAGTSGNVVVGNLIGTDKSGAIAIGNVSDGIRIDSGASANTIGGTAPASANVIAGGFNVASSGGGSSQAGAVFSLGAPTVVGNVARFDVTVTYTDAPPSVMVFLGVDYRNSDGALEPIDPATNLPDFSAFHFYPSSVLGPGWAALEQVFPGEVEYHTPPPLSPQLLTPLRPNATYVVGTLAYDISKFGTVPDPSLLVSIEGIDTTVGTEPAGAPTNNFNFIDPSYSPGERSFAPGPGTAGVEVAGPGTSGNVILGNLVGTNPAGTSDLGHFTDDVLIHGGAANNTVGGAAPGAGNVIAGADDGVVVSDPGSSGDLVQGNHIGTNVSGTADLGNTVTGVLLEEGARSDTVTGNTVAFNGEGVVIGSSPSDTATAHDTVRGNTFFGNAGPAIDLGNRGGATGTPAGLPNDAQAAPAITTLTLHGVGGTLASVPNTPFQIEIYASPVGRAGQAQHLLGSLQVRTGGTGAAGFTLPVANLPLGMVFTATATNLATGDTSGFSVPGTEILVLAAPVITSSAAGQGVTFSAQIYSGYNPVTAGNVRFTVAGLPGAVSGTPNAGGVVTVTFPLSAGLAARTYTVQATFAGTADVPPGVGDGSLTVLPSLSTSRRWQR